MSRRLQATLLAAAVALSPIPLVATSAPAAAQVNVNVGVNVGFDYFYDGLSQYGDWNYHPRWGDVWRPARVGADFRPYFRGYWVNTEYGMTFRSEEPWGDLTYHYGRWVFDPYDGWLWVPGYTWAPAWVVWRGDARNIGWFPMPPDDRFLAGVEVYRDDWDWNRGYFGYSDWYGPSIATGLLAAWTFVALDRFADRDYYRYAQPRTQIVNIVNNTTNITNYVTVNNRIVNRSVDVAQIERASGRRIERVEARQVVRAPITTVDAGRQVVMRERERHGGDVRAPARERVQRLDAQEAKLPVQDRRSLRGPRDRDQQQAQQPQGQQAPEANRGGRIDRNQQRDQQQAQPQQQQAPDADRGGRFERNQQRDQKAAEPRGRIERDKQGAIEPSQPADRGAAIQQQREEQQNRAAAERQQRDQAEQQNRARAEQQRGEQQNRAAAERQQRDQAEQQNRARAEQPQRAEQPNPAREEQAARAQKAVRQQQAQAEQQNRARAQQTERQQQQQAAAEERQQRAKAKQQKEEEEKAGKARN